MKAESLKEVYAEFGDYLTKIFVVPLIRFESPKSDYLYLLYKDLLNDEKYEITNVSVFSHFKFVWHQLTGRKSILHYHWLEFQDLKSLTGMPWKLTCIFLYKLFGGHIIWTIHNLEPHDQKWLGLHLRLHKWMVRIADRIHVHCSSSIKPVVDSFQADPSKVFVLEHPVYPAKTIGKHESINHLKKKFGIEFEPSFPVFLMFGNITKYKGIKEVAKLFTQDFRKAILLIVGPVKKGNDTLKSDLKGITSQYNNIILYSHFVDDKDIAFFYGSSDFCLFNFRQILTSGSVIMAESFRKQIIAPHKGCIKEKASNKNYHLFNSREDLKRVINEVINTFQDDQN